MSTMAGSAASGAPGAPTQAEASKTRVNAQTGAATSSMKYVWELPINQPGARNEYPTVKTPVDAYDDTANIKSQYAQQAAGTNWVVPFEQSDAQWLLRKRDVEENAAFESWVMQKFNITDPSQNLMLQQIAPELYRRREELIMSQQDLASRYAKLRLRGAKTLDDLRFEWLIETQRISLPKGPIWDPVQWRAAQYNNAALDPVADAQANNNRYRHGLFSPMKWLVWDERGWAPTDNRADIRGNPAVRFPSALVTLPVDAEMATRWSYAAPYPYIPTGLEAGVAAANVANPAQVAAVGANFAAAAPVGVV